MRLGWVALVTGALLLGACTTEQELVSDRESLLSAAGFAFRPANTPERQQQLANLPPRQFTYQERNGKVVYLYGDAQYLQMPLHRLQSRTTKPISRWCSSAGLRSRICRPRR